MDSDEKKSDIDFIAEIDKLIHAPARLMILAILNNVESVDWLFIMKQTKLTRGNLSSHLKKLEGAEYIKVKKEFVDRIPRTLISITKKGKIAIAEYYKNMEKFLNKNFISK
jgi:DNA-binding MarR family transcriptional regulator